MAPRKRKAPEPKRRSFMAALMSTTVLGLGQLGAGLGRFVFRHPRPVFGGLGFAAIFSAIAANALWYQPHRLTKPFLVTRNLADYDQLPGLRQPPSAPEQEVTTYKIQREDEGVVVEDEDVAAVPRSTATIATVTPAATLVPHQPENVALAVAVQQALKSRGLYDGVADGVIGPRTAAAILFFQQTAGLPETGEVSEELLSALAADGSLARQASAETVAHAETPALDEDPVAAAIRTADIPSPAGKSTHAGGNGAQLVKVSGASDELADLIRTGGSGGAQADLVIKIQKGLARMQYADVTPDGVLGSQTRAAILKFEKAYGLPPTGEANERVLQKLRDIGMV